MPMQNRHIVSDSDIKMIFLNIEDILVCNASLLNRLENAQVNNYVDCVGFIFKEHVYIEFIIFINYINI